MKNESNLNDHFAYQAFPEGYGKFPYIIWKVAYATFMQIPVHFVPKGSNKKIPPGGKIEVENYNNLNDDELIVLYKHELIELVKIVNINMKRDKGAPQKLCLVCSPTKAFYFDDDKIEESNSIPNKGNLLSMDNKLIAMVAKHYKTN